MGTVLQELEQWAKWLSPTLTMTCPPLSWTHSIVFKKRPPPADVQKILGGPTKEVAMSTEASPKLFNLQYRTQRLLEDYVRDVRKVILVHSLRLSELIPHASLLVATDFAAACS